MATLQMKPRDPGGVAGPLTGPVLPPPPPTSAPPGQKAPALTYRYDDQAGKYTEYNPSAGPAETPAQRMRRIEAEQAAKAAKGAGGAGSKGPGKPKLTAAQEWLISEGMSKRQAGRLGELAGLGFNEGKAIKDEYAKILSGEKSRYSDERVAEMDAAAKSAALGSQKVAQDEIYRDALRRGIFRSGVTSRGIADTHRQAIASYTQAKTDIRQKKADADFDDRLVALKGTQDWLNSMRQHIAQLDATASQKEVGMAQVGLGYAQLELEKQKMAKAGGSRGNDFMDGIITFKGQDGNDYQMTRREFVFNKEQGLL